MTFFFMQKGSFRHWEAMTFSGGFHPENPRGSGEAKSPARYGAGTQKSVCYIPCATPLCYKPNLALGFPPLATLPLLNIVLLLFHRSKLLNDPLHCQKSTLFVDEKSMKVLLIRAIMTLYIPLHLQNGEAEFLHPD